MNTKPHTVCKSQGIVSEETKCMPPLCIQVLATDSKFLGLSGQLSSDWWIKDVFSALGQRKVFRGSYCFYLRRLYVAALTGLHGVDAKDQNINLHCRLQACIIKQGFSATTRGPCEITHIASVNFANNCLFLLQQPPVGQGLLIHEVSRYTHNDASQSIGLPGRVISSSQRPIADNKQHSQQKNIHAPSGIRTHNLSRRAAADRLRPRDHWDRLAENLIKTKKRPTAF
jgi:hypothetical protein